jgi:transglutaminase-like putative cysteine protease
MSNGIIHLDIPSPYLQSTVYSDSEHPDIQRWAWTLTTDCATDVERACQLFYWVRDAIAFHVSDWNYPASATLARRCGTCSNKANLFVSLARALNIPGGFHVMRVDGKAYFGPIVTPTLRRQIRTRSLHVYAGVLLNGQWVRCDPSDDKAFSTNTQHLNPQSTLVEWDGVRDALLQLDRHHILDDQGPVATIDPLLARKPRLPTYMARLGNLYIQFLREHGAAHHTLAELEPAFIRWLWRHTPPLGVVYGYLSWQRER